jgi:hypothetical protein
MKEISPELRRDLRLFQGMLLFLAVAMLFVAYDLYSAGACPLPYGIYLTLVSKFCSLTGLTVTVASVVALALYLSGYAFSDHVKARVERLHSLARR